MSKLPGRRRGTRFHRVAWAGGELDVVDARLNVRGMQALRVIDSSIMPDFTSSNINIPTIMIGEKGADMVLADAAVAH
jgi:choline dehydrogenase